MGRNSKKKVMVFGVFDLLHPGHVNFLRQAKKLGSELVVSIARDVNVKKVKGRFPVQNERVRLAAVRKLKFIDKAILGALRNPLPHIKKEKPDVIALGYDQKSYINMGELKKIAKVVRLKSYKPQVYKSALVRKNV